MLKKISTRITFLILALSLVPVSVNSMESVYKAKINSLISFINPIQENRINALCKIVSENRGKIILASGIVLILGYKYCTRSSAYHDDSHPGKIEDYDVNHHYEPARKIFWDNTRTLIEESYIDGLKRLVFWRSETDTFIWKLLGCKESAADSKVQTTIKIIKTNNQVAGFMTFVTYNNSAKIELLAVDKKYRRRGFGLQLLAEAQKMAEENKNEHLKISVKKNNKPAIELYKKFGFIESYGGRTYNQIMIKPVEDKQN